MDRSGLVVEKDEAYYRDQSVQDIHQLTPQGSAMIDEPRPLKVETPKIGDVAMGASPGAKKGLTICKKSTVARYVAMAVLYSGCLQRRTHLISGLVSGRY